MLIYWSQKFYFRVGYDPGMDKYGVWFGLRFKSYPEYGLVSWKTGFQFYWRDLLPPRRMWVRIGNGDGIYSGSWTGLSPVAVQYDWWNWRPKVCWFHER